MLVASASRATCQTDEIQVYDGSIAAVHEFGLTLHTNYVIQGTTAPAFPGAVTADHSLNGAAEFAYGAADWFEAGLYFPVWTADASTGLGYDGMKLRALFVAPHGDARRFAYGVNFEFSINQPRWDPARYTGEARFILAWHFTGWDLILNPIFDTSFDGLAAVDFAPCARIDWNASARWSFALEQYSDFGTLRDLAPWDQQVHQLFAVADRHWTHWDAEFGVGYGLTGVSDPWVVKLILSTVLTR